MISKISSKLQCLLLCLFVLAQAGSVWAADSSTYPSTAETSSESTNATEMNEHCKDMLRIKPINTKEQQEKHSLSSIHFQCCEICECTDSLCSQLLSAISTPALNPSHKQAIRLTRLNCSRPTDQAAPIFHPPISA